MGTLLPWSTARDRYRHGSVIEYATFSGAIRTVTVTQHLDNIKNGRPGFDGTLADGDTVWGYDEQITRILRY